MQLFLQNNFYDRTLLNRFICLQIDDNVKTIGNLLDAVKKELTIRKVEPINGIYLVYGKILNVNNSLEYYKITDNCTINMHYSFNFC